MAAPMPVAPPEMTMDLSLRWEKEEGLGLKSAMVGMVWRVSLGWRRGGCRLVWCAGGFQGLTLASAQRSLELLEDCNCSDQTVSSRSMVDMYRLFVDDVENRRMQKGLGWFWVGTRCFQALMVPRQARLTRLESRLDDNSTVRADLFSRVLREHVNTVEDRDVM